MAVPFPRGFSWPPETMKAGGCDDNLRRAGIPRPPLRLAPAPLQLVGAVKSPQGRLAPLRQGGLFHALDGPLQG